MLALARTIADRLVGLSAFLGAVALTAITVTVIVDVVGRLFHAPLYGARDIVQMAAVFVVFGGMAYCERTGGHITVDILEPVFSARVNRALVILGSLVGAVVFALIAWQVWEASKLSLLLKMSTNILFLPRAPFQYAMAAMSALASLYLLLKAIVSLSGNSE